MKQKNTKQTKRVAARVGQIGLGIMGGAFAKHLRAARFDVSGYDLDAGRRKALQALGGDAEASIGDVAARCDVVITSLPSIKAVESVFFGAGGQLERAAPGSIVIETSTLPLEVKLDVRERMLARRVSVLDCPISGTGNI